MAAGELVEAPGVRLARMAGEGRTKGNDKPHQFRRLFREFARVEAAEAPADDADLAFVLTIQFAERVVGTLQDPVAQTRPELALQDSSYESSSQRRANLELHFGLRKNEGIAEAAPLSADAGDFLRPVLYYFSTDLAIDDLLTVSNVHIPARWPELEKRAS